MNLIIPIVAVFLLIVSIIDWKTKKIPSIFLTGMLLVVLMVNRDNLIFGVFAGVFALLLMEFGDSVNLPFGIAELKVIIILGLMISNVYFFLIFLIIFSIFQFIYILIIRKISKKKGEIPFLPVFLFCFIALWILGGIR